MSNEIQKLSSADFPPLLNEIPDPPSALYARGLLPPKENKLLCVVGSRKYSTYGKRVCQHLISSLAGYPVSIVSGLALGIDGIAHQTALRAGLHTLAVPGSGIDSTALYPASHHGLARDIITNGGGLVSEFEPHFKATVWSFPKRNRIMAGMSHATLIIEATPRSGTLITARLANEYNRDVCVVPGDIFLESAQGPLGLLRDGAIPVTQPEDILEVLGLEPVENNTSTPSSRYENCTENEQCILSLLTNPLGRDELIHHAQLPLKDINIALSLLEMKGYIKEERGLLYRI